MGSRRVSVSMTMPQVHMLLHLLEDNAEEGSYFGPKMQYWNRHRDLLAILQDVAAGVSVEYVDAAQ